MTGCFSFLKRGKKLPVKETEYACVECWTMPPYQPPPKYLKQGEANSAESSNEKVEGIISDVADTIEQKVQDLSKELRELSLSMFKHPEVKWEEHKTHDLFVNYFEKQEGWKVVPHAYGIETAFMVEFTHRSKKSSTNERLTTVGFQSELDALPGIGQGCGHPLIALSGVGASLAVAEALVKYDQSGRIVLLGTPAEEGGGGKLTLIQAGAYKEMDACLMIHPAPLSSVGAMIAVIEIDAHYTGRTSHAGAAPWEGINAQDAGVLAIKPTHRIHGIIQSKDWAANVIPSSCSLIFNARAPTVQELEKLIPRVVNCFEAAAIATGCEVEVKKSSLYKNVVNSPSLSKSYQSFMKKRYNDEVGEEIFYASTDFGNVTFELPGLHAEFAIPLKNIETDGNHTIGFEKAAKTMESHELTLRSATGIATVGAKFIFEEDFRKQTQREWREWKDGLSKT